MKFIRIINKFEDSLLVLILSSMIILAVLQIAFRNFFGEGIEWIDPLLRVLVLWIAMVGAMVAARTDNHIRIDIFSRYFPVRYAPMLQRLVYVITAAICLLIAWHGTRFVYSEYEYHDIAFANIPSWLTASIIPIGFFLIALRYILLFFFPVNTEHQPARS